MHEVRSSCGRPAVVARLLPQGTDEAVQEAGRTGHPNCSQADSG